jgi:cytochrome c-type biogenesis protein CcmH
VRRRSARRLAALALAIAAALAGPAATAIAAECPRTTLADVEDEVMCPVCGTPLALATEAPQAKRERELIVRLIGRCKSKPEVKATLAAEFGEDVLALPDDEGFDLAAYLVPALALLLAGGGVAAATVRWRRARLAAPPKSDSASDDRASAKLDSDLERYDL